jgi:ABC-type sugar transport system ATPase subunit
LSTTDATDFISFSQLSKSFAKTRAVAGLDLTIGSGEVLGLVGANGAGKSTLLKVITGIVQPSSGTMRLLGEDVHLGHYTPRAAQEAGIHCVYQELSLCNNLTVAENFQLSRSYSQGRSRATMVEVAQRAVEMVFARPGFAAKAEVGQLQHAQRQMVEIARAATQPGLRLLILDEPTSALPAERVGQLHAFLAGCGEQGIGVIYVTHKLGELLTVSNRIVVLRSGRKELDAEVALVSSESLVQHLGGGSGVVHARRPDLAAAADDEQPPPVAPDEKSPLVEVATAQATSGPHWHGGPLVVRAGEVVGIAGLEGAGQKQLLRDIFAAASRRATKRIVIRAPVAYISGDRKREAVFPLWTISENMALTGLGSMASRIGVIRPKKVREVVGRWFTELAIVARSPQAYISELSGGNQQKVVIARELASGAGVLLMDDPTRGVDLETKEAVYALLEALKAEGRAALFYSTEDGEFRYCDRVYVLAGGQLVHELVGPEQITPENIISWSYKGLERVQA